LHHPFTWYSPCMVFSLCIVPFQDILPLHNPFAQYICMVFSAAFAQSIFKILSLCTIPLQGILPLHNPFSRYSPFAQSLCTIHLHGILPLLVYT
jgi:hypothetical protein